MGKHIAIVGGGPSGLFIFREFIRSAVKDLKIEIFELKEKLGTGMPYSFAGANREHITNVSGNEIPDVIIPLMDWLKTLPVEKLGTYKIDVNEFSDYRVLPRLLFGDYLSDQFKLLLTQAKSIGLDTIVHLNSRVVDIKDSPGEGHVRLEIENKQVLNFDIVVICTGHEWPLTYERKVSGYYDSPYPPQKLNQRFNHTVAIRGSSLTAIDAIRTIARSNGEFVYGDTNNTRFIANENTPGFRLVMHSREGLLPAVRFHLEDPRLSKNKLIGKSEILEHREKNNGFLSLDFIFEKDFKEPLKEKDPELYECIKNMQIEDFVNYMMELRTIADPFEFFKAEYKEARKSIERHESVYWKELLAVLSFAMNYPAKHFSAEDMIRLHKILMPLISIVIAFVPQSSCEELVALHNAGVLELISVGDDSKVTAESDNQIIYQYVDDKGIAQKSEFKTFVDCIGQRHLMRDSFPFKSLVKDGTISKARLRFQSSAKAIQLRNEGDNNVTQDENELYYLDVPGIAIDDFFRIVQENGNQNERIYLMAVPYLGGYNPDYSGIDFCEEAAGIIVKKILQLN